MTTHRVSPFLRRSDSPHIPAHGEEIPTRPKKARQKTPKSKAHRPDVQADRALRWPNCSIPPINRGRKRAGFRPTGLQAAAGQFARTGRSGGEAAVHRARGASTRGVSDDVAKRDTSSSALRGSPPPNPPPQAGEGLCAAGTEAQMTAIDPRTCNDRPLSRLRGEGQGGGCIREFSGFDEAPASQLRHRGDDFRRSIPRLARQLGLPTAEDDDEALGRGRRAARWRRSASRRPRMRWENLIREGPSGIPQGGRHA